MDIRSTSINYCSQLIDYYDIHYYPQADNVNSHATDATTSALRLRSVKSLYDPSYVDGMFPLSDIIVANFVAESWINDKIYLIPRFKQLIATYASWMMFSISEYNFGEEGIASGLAQAEALAVSYKVI